MRAGGRGATWGFRIVELRPAKRLSGLRWNTFGGMSVGGVVLGRAKHRGRAGGWRK